jgi:outer membrane protein assembly factor BamB
MGDKVLAINGSGVLACGDAKTGQLKWRLRLDGSGKSSPVAAGDHLYWINEKGLLQAVLVGDSEGKVVGSIDVKQTIHGTPSISGDALYLRGDGELWKIARD